MKVVPIRSSDSPRNHLKRATISIRFQGRKEEYSVLDRCTGERFVRPEKEAWKLFHDLNILV